MSYEQKYKHHFLFKNTFGKDYVVGDIHGCMDKLKEAMREVSFDPAVDRLFSVGDLIDRGPDNLECLRLITEPWFYPVIGNHEDMLIEAVFRGRSLDWMYNGGKWAKDFLSSEDKEFLLLAELLNRYVPTAMTVQTEFGTLGICHAEPISYDWADMHRKLTEEEYSKVIWGRNRIFDNTCTTIANIDLTVHGHTPTEDAKRIENSVFIDLGSYLSHFGNSSYKGVTIFSLEELFNKVSG